MKKKIKEWIKRYRLSELMSYSLAMIWGYLTFKYTNNYYYSWIVVIIWDNLWYYWTIIFKEIMNTIKIKKYYNLKLFLKDIRNLWFEFWPPQILEIFIIYPLLMFYIPPLFNIYSIWH